MGPDLIHPKILKELALELKLPVTLILQKSFDEQTVPNQWKTAFVSPIHKKGDKMYHI